MRIQEEFSKGLKIQPLKQMSKLSFFSLGCRILDVTFFRLVCAWMMILISGQMASAADVSGHVSRVGDATHVEFRGKDQWNYELEKSGKQKVRLVVPPFDVPTEAVMKTWSDALVSGISVDKNGKDGKYIITFDLASDKVESFDYLTDEPSRLIVDFYLPEVPKQNKPEESKTAVKKGKAAKGKRVAKKGKISKDRGDQDYTKRNADRDPAGSELLGVDDSLKGSRVAGIAGLTGVFDGNDPRYSRFIVKDHEIKEEAIIASKQNIYIRFPMLSMSASELSTLVENSPEYAIRPNDEEENKRARFLLTLFMKNRPAAFLKTYDFFVRQYPDSIYDEIVRNLSAETHYRLYTETGEALHYARAKSEYEYLLAKYPDSPLAERTELFLGYMDLERKDGVGALQVFQRFLETKPNSTERDKAQRALGAAYLMLKKFADATKAYKELEKSAKDKSMSKEATYRLGDVAFSRRDYPEAIKLYQEALKTHPESESQFPNAHYNMAESFFWTGDYPKSLEHYLAYLRLFPSHDHGGYAITRIGELMEIMGVDQGRVMGAFLESYFRFRENPGAGVARVRMLSQRMKGMKENELERSVKEMREIGDKSELPRMGEFVNLMIADGYHRRGEYKKALDFLVSYYQQNPTSSNLDFFHRRILRNITDDLGGMIARNDYMDVLGTFSKHSATWLKNPDRLDVPYFLGQAYERAGVFKEAGKIYGSLLASLDKIKGTSEERERRVNEHLPTMDELYLRLSSVALKGRQTTEASQHLQRIEKPDQLKPENQVEWVENMAHVAEERGKTKEAVKHLLSLTDSWKDKPELLPPIYLRLAEMQIKGGQLDDAESSLGLIKKMQANKVSVDEDVWAKALERRGDVLLHQGKSVAAVEAYLEMLDEFEDKRPLAYVRYKVGSILYEKGDLKGAEKIWASLSGDNGQMYRKLADERLTQAQWQDDYKKYINRIPAMSGVKKGR